MFWKSTLNGKHFNGIIGFFIETACLACFLNFELYRLTLKKFSTKNYLKTQVCLGLGLIFSIFNKFRGLMPPLNIAMIEILVFYLTEIYLLSKLSQPLWWFFSNYFFKSMIHLKIITGIANSGFLFQVLLNRFKWNLKISLNKV